MRQFILPEDWEGGSRCVIGGGRAKYLSRVLRLAAGDFLPAMDVAGEQWLCRVETVDAERLVLSVLPPPPGSREGGLADLRGHGPEGSGPSAPLMERDGPSAAPRLILAQGLPKGAKMDLVIRQATEAGVSLVIPLLTERSAARGEEASTTRRRRWDRIVREALQQSGSAIPTRVEDPLSIGSLAESYGPSPGRIALLFHEAPLAQSSLHGYLTGGPEEILLCVGPEGGFSPDEAKRLVEASFAPHRLPGAVLRAETAALYAVAAVQTILAERSLWILNRP